ATPRHLSDRMGRWLFESDARRRHLALSAYLLRLLAPDEPLALTACSGSVESQRVDLPDGRVVVGVTGTGADAARTVTQVCSAIAAGGRRGGRARVRALGVVRAAGAVG